MTEQTLQAHSEEQKELIPLLPLRDVVVYPHLVIPLFVGRAKSVKALEIASDTNKQILLVAQKSANKDDPDADDLYEIGTMATVLQCLNCRMVQSKYWWKGSIAYAFQVSLKQKNALWLMRIK
jgi:ATP-dependent Lon protease